MKKLLTILTLLVAFVTQGWADGESSLIANFSTMNAEKCSYKAIGTMVTTADRKGIQWWIGDNSTYTGEKLVVITSESCKLGFGIGVFQSGANGETNEINPYEYSEATTHEIIFDNNIKSKNIQKIQISNQTSGTVTILRAYLVNTVETVEQQTEIDLSAFSKMSDEVTYTISYQMTTTEGWNGIQDWISSDNPSASRLVVRTSEATDKLSITVGYTDGTSNIFSNGYTSTSERTMLLDSKRAIQKVQIVNTDGTNPSSITFTEINIDNSTDGSPETASLNLVEAFSPESGVTYNTYNASYHKQMVTTSGWTGMSFSPAATTETKLSCITVNTDAAASLKVAVYYADGWAHEYFDDTSNAPTSRTFKLDANRVIGMVQIQDEVGGQTISFSDISLSTPESPSYTVQNAPKVYLSISNMVSDGIATYADNKLSIIASKTSTLNSVSKQGKNLVVNFESAAKANITVTYSDESSYVYNSGESGATTRTLKLEDKEISKIEIENTEESDIVVTSLYLNEENNSGSEAGVAPVSNVFDAEGNADISKLVGATYNSTVGTATITASTAWTGATLTPAESETITGKSRLVATFSAEQEVTVIANYTGTAGFSSITKGADNGSSSDFVVVVPLDNSKTLASVVIKKVTTGDMVLKSLVVDTGTDGVPSGNIIGSDGKVDLTRFAVQNVDSRYNTGTYTLTPKEGYTGIQIWPASENVSGKKELNVKFTEAAAAKIEVGYVSEGSSYIIMSEAAKEVKLSLNNSKTIQSIVIQPTTAATIKLSEVALNAERTLYENEKELLNPTTKPVISNNTNTQTIDYWKFANAADGDKIIVLVSNITTATEGDNSGKAKLTMSAAGQRASLGHAWGAYADKEFTSATTDLQEIVYNLTGDNLTYVKNHGFFVNVSYGSFQLEKISLISASDIPTAEPNVFDAITKKADLSRFTASDASNYTKQDDYYQFSASNTTDAITLDITSTEGVKGANLGVQMTFAEAASVNVSYKYDGDSESQSESFSSVTTATIPLDESKALTQLVIQSTSTEAQTIKLSSVAIVDYSPYIGTELVTADGSEVASTAFPFQFKAESSEGAGDGTNWKKANFAAGQFTSVKAGDKIYIYADQAESSSIALQEYGGGDALPNGNALSVSDGKAVYELTATAAAFLKDNGASLTGQNYTVNKVTLVAGDGTASNTVTMDVANFYDITGGKRLYFGSGSAQTISGNKELTVTFSDAITATTTVEVTYVNAETAVSSNSAESGATTITVPLISDATIKKIEVKSTGTITMSAIAITDSENPNERELYNPETKPSVTTESGLTVAEYWKFGNAAVGDKIIVYGSDIAESTTIALKGAGSNGVDSNNTAFNWTQFASGSFTDSKFEHTLIADDLTNLQANGLFTIASAGSFKINKVTLISATAIPTSEPVALNEGDEEPDASTVDATEVFSTQTALGSYDVNSVQVAAAAFANVKANDYIKVYLSSMTDNSELALQNLGTWANLTGFTTVKPSKNATKYVYKITTSALTELQANGLVIKGKDCTIDKIELLTAKSETPTAIFNSEGKADLSKVEKYGTNVTYTYSEGVGTIASASQWEGVYLNLENESPLVSGAELEVTMQENSNFGVYVVYTDNTATDGSADVSGSTESGKTVTLELNKEKKIKQIQIKSHAAETTTLKLTNIILKQTSSTNTEKTLTTAVTPEGSGSVKVQTVVGETVTDTEDTSFASGTVLKLTAIVNSGYAFSKWMSGDTELAANSDKTLTVTMDEDKTITAVFVADESSDANAIWTGDAAISWDNDSYAGATFDTYSQDPAVSFSGLAKNDTIQIITSDVTEGAQYVLQYKVGDSWEWTNLVEIQNAVPDTIKYVVATSQIADLIAQRGLIISGIKYHIKKIRLMKAPVATTYTLTTSATNGSITVKIGDTETTDNEFEADTELTLTAKTTDDYELYKWQVNGQDTTLTATTMTVKMTADIAVNAVFKPKDTDAKAVWTGYETLTSSTYFDTYAVPVTKSNILSNVVAGDTIMVFPMNVEENANYQLQYKVGDNWEWTDLVATTTSVPDTIKYVVTSETATLIAQRGMVVKGDGYSIRKISVHSVPTTPVFNSDGKADLSKFSADAATYTYADGKGTLVTGEEGWKGISVSLPSDEYFQATKLTVKFAASAPAYVHVSYDGETEWKSGDTYDKSGTGTELVLPLDHSKKVSTIHIQLTEANTTAVLTEVSISNMCTLTTSAVNGNITVIKGDETESTDNREFEYGTKLKLTATPAGSDYSFKQWVIGETTKTDNPYTFTITGDTEITAEFKSADEDVIWLGSQEINWNTGTSQTIAVTKENNLKIDDQLVFTITPAVEGIEWPQLQLSSKSDGTPVLIGTANTSIDKNTTEVKYYVTKAMLNDITENGGFIVSGAVFELTKVWIERGNGGEGYENAIWIGEKEYPSNWSVYTTIGKDLFANATVGQVIRMKYKDVKTGSSMSFSYDNDGWVALPDAASVTPSGLATKLTITEDMLTTLKAGGLIISGINFTLTSVELLDASAIKTLTGTVPVTGDDWVWTSSETPSFTVNVKNENSEAVTAEAVMLIKTDKLADVKTLTENKEIAANGSGTITFTYKPESAGFYNATVILNDETVRSFNFGYAPTEIVSAADKQSDFDSYWAAAKSQLAAVEASDTPVLTEMTDKSTSKRKVYLVEFKSIPDGTSGDPVTVRGYYCEPTDGVKHPVLMHYQGYDSFTYGPGGTAPDVYCPSGDDNPDYAEFVLSTRGQALNNREPYKSNGGNPYGQDGWFKANFGDKDSYYYRGAYMDVVRAIDFMATRETSDMDNLFAEGQSQGGAFTYAAAALSGRTFKAIAPAITFMGDFPDYFELASWPGNEAKEMQAKLGWTDEQLYAFMSYYDTKNLATKVSCPVITSIGVQDNVCPPHTNIAPYNNVTTGSSDKQVIFNAELQHATNSEWNTVMMKFFDKYNTWEDPNAKKLGRVARIWVLNGLL